MIPERIIRDLIIETHEIYGHIGSKKLFMMLNENFYYKKFRNKINQIIKSCKNCQFNKHLQCGNFTEMQTIETSAPNELLSIAFYGPLTISTAKCAHILVTIDAFSEYVGLYPIVNASTKTVIKKLIDDYIPKYGKPKRILMDHGTQFTSPKLLEKLKDLGIKYTFTSIRHPCANIVERTNKELGRLFRSLIKIKHTEWFTKLPIIQKILNEVHHDTKEFTPIELHFNRKPTRFWTTLFNFEKPGPSIEQKLEPTAKKIRKKGNHGADKHANKHKFTRFEIGDHVLIKANRVSDKDQKIIAKFLSIWEEPYELAEKYRIILSL